MRANPVSQLLSERSMVVNAWVATGNPYTAEVLGHCGYDAVTVDLQHGMFGVESAIACLQAISGSPATPLVRCRSKDAADIGHLLDAGAYGVICPAVDSVDDAAHLVAACRYPPDGRRSFGPARGLLYGGSDYAAQANSEILPVAMIESPNAIEVLDDILGVEGLGAVFVGPNDLAVAGGWDLLGDGLPGPDLGPALKHIVERARAAGVPAGIFAPTGEQAVEFAAWGYLLITPGNDVGLLRAESARRLGALRAAR